MLENALYKKKKQYKNRYECPTCKTTGCFSHCNNCGIEIIWKNEQGDAVYTSGKRVIFENDFSIHKCMKKGTKSGQFLDTSTFNESDWKAEMRKYSYCQQNYMCMECARKFNKEIYPKCPSCWKMQCRKCYNKQSWRADKPLNQCYNCKHDKLDPVHVWSAYDRLYGAREF